MTLMRWLTFLLGSQTVILSVLLFWIYLFLLALVFVLEWLSDHVIVSVSFDSPSYLQWDATFHHVAYHYSCTDWDGLCDHLKHVPWEDIFKLDAFAAASEFCEWVQVGIQGVSPKMVILTVFRQLGICD